MGIVAWNLCPLLVTIFFSILKKSGSGTKLVCIFRLK